MRTANALILYLLLLLFTGGLLSSCNTSTPEQTLNTDLNGDHLTDSLDLIVFNESFGKPAEANYSADFNGDSIINVDDLVILLNEMNANHKK